MGTPLGVSHLQSARLRVPPGLQLTVGHVLLSLGLSCENLKQYIKSYISTELGTDDHCLQC